jgi:hypothetical protein
VQHSVGIWHDLAQFPVNPERFGEPNGIVGVSNYICCTLKPERQRRVERIMTSDPPHSMTEYMSPQKSMSSRSGELFSMCWYLDHERLDVRLPSTMFSYKFLLAGNRVVLPSDPCTVHNYASSNLEKTSGRVDPMPLPQRVVSFQVILGIAC